MGFKIEQKFNATVLNEYSVAIGGWTYLVIYGRHINGYFCCIPNWKIGCEMSDPNEVAYNCDKLIDCGMKQDVAKELAESILFMSKGENQ